MTGAVATEVWRMGATELAEIIRSRQASAEEVIEAHLRRIEAVNPSINAVVIVMAEEALAGTDLDDGQVAEDIRSMPMAMAVNALGLPAVALPVGISDGLPQAVQVVGARYREDLCLDAAGAIEGRLGIITPIEPR